MSSASSTSARVAMPTSSADAWFPSLREHAWPALRLFCFPYAGGAPSIYRGWQEVVPEGVQVLPVLLPGRGIRNGEPPFRVMGPLVEAIARAIHELGPRPYALFGHSMGGLLAFEIAHRMSSAGLPRPRHLFVSGCRPPHLHGHGRTHALPAERLIEVVRSLGAAGADLLADSETAARRLPVLRADLAVCERHRWIPRPALECPLTAFGGDADPIVSPGELELWRDYTRSSFLYRRLPGDHFFIMGEGRAPLLRALARELDCLGPTEPCEPFNASGAKVSA